MALPTPSARTRSFVYQADSDFMNGIRSDGGEIASPQPHRVAAHRTSKSTAGAVAVPPDGSDYLVQALRALLR